MHSTGRKEGSTQNRLSILIIFSLSMHGNGNHTHSHTHTAQNIQAKSEKMAEIRGAPKRTKPPKLTLEGYLDFIRTEKRLDLTVDHLNQIIHMHGFKKIHKTHKSTLLEVVGKLELMDPTRSTIEDAGVTSDAALSLVDVIKDLNDLQWQECCITSLETLNAVSHQPPASLGSGGCSVGTVVSASSEQQPRKPRRKLIKLSEVEGNRAEKEIVSPTLNTGSSEKLPSKPLLENWSPRRKRTVECVNVIGRSVGVASPPAAHEVQHSSLAVTTALDA